MREPYHSYTLISFLTSPRIEVREIDKHQVLSLWWSNRNSFELSNGILLCGLTILIPPVISIPIDEIVEYLKDIIGFENENKFKVGSIEKAKAYLEALPIMTAEKLIEDENTNTIADLV